VADNSKIEWTEATWNPVTGCTKVSPGCDHCYAETFAERFRGVPGHHFEQGFDVVLRPERLDQPLRWRKPRRIFTNSMSDLFHKDIPANFIARMFAVMALAPQHTFQVLTKRHGRMATLLNSPGFHWKVCEIAPEYGKNPDLAQDYVRSTWPLPNVWLGVSVENQHWADIRIPALLQTPSAVRWLSCEPLLGPVDLSVVPGLQGQYGHDGRHHGTGEPGCPRWLHHHHDERCRFPIDWCVAGGESGPGARPMQLEWARSLREHCRDSRVPFFVKQLGSVWASDTWYGGERVSKTDKKGGDWQFWPNDLRVREYPGGES
jgi:protein gp37